MAVPSEEAPGWDAIDGALTAIYGRAEPKHYGTVKSWHEGGNDPIEGISVYLRDEPTPHFHFVTYGFTELWGKESDDSSTSGFGFELTFRLARADEEEEPPAWALHFLQNLGRYVFRTGNAFAAGHKMGLNGPIALGERTSITAVCFAADPELGAFESPNGQAEFLQIVGITDDEYRLIQDWCTDGLVELLAMRSPMLLTELWRPSILARPGVVELLQERIEREGSSETSSFAGDLAYASDGSRVVITLGALYAPAIRRAMLGRIRHYRSYQLIGHTTTAAFEPGEAAWRIDDGTLVLSVPPGLAKKLAAQVGERAGRYELSIPGVTLVVAPTYIRDQAGRVVDVKGVDDDQIEELAAAENAKLQLRPPAVVEEPPRAARAASAPGALAPPISAKRPASAAKAAAKKPTVARPAEKKPTTPAGAPARKPTGRSGAKPAVVAKGKKPAPARSRPAAKKAALKGAATAATKRTPKAATKAATKAAKTPAAARSAKKAAGKKPTRAAPRRPASRAASSR